MVTLVTGGLGGPLILTGGLLPAPPPASAVVTRGLGTGPRLVTRGLGTGPRLVSTFAKPVNYHDLLPPIVLTVPHAAGTATLVLPAGAGTRLGTLPPNRIFRVTALQFPGTTAEQVKGIFKATGIDGDTLTDVSGDEGFDNVALPAGATIEVRSTARDLSEIQDAVNAAEATVGANSAALEGKQPLDADLTAIAGLSHAKGQVIVDDGSAWVALAPGADTRVLTLDSTTAVGVKWAAPAPGVTPGGPAGAIQTNDGAGGFAGPAHARVNAAGSLKIDGQAGEYPIEVFTPDGLTPIFRVTNTTGDVFGAGAYSSGVGFRATAFGAYVGVSNANRVTFPGASPSILANPLGASTSVFGIQGASGQTANLQEWLDSSGAVLASVGPAGTLTLGSLGGLLKATSGAVSTATAGTDYLTPTGSGAALTGITGSQVSGNIAGNAAGLTGSIAESQVTNLTTDLAAKEPAWASAQVSGSDATTTGQSLIDATGLSIAAVANATYEVEAVLLCTTTAVTTGTKYGVQFSAAGASCAVIVSGAVTSTTGGITSLNALATGSATAFLTTASQAGIVVIKGTVVTGANAGNITVQHLKVTSGTSTIKVGSVLRARRLL